MSSTHFMEFTYVEKLLSFLYHQFLYIRKRYVQIVFGYWNVPHTWSDTKWEEWSIIMEQLLLSPPVDMYVLSIEERNNCYVMMVHFAHLVSDQVWGTFWYPKTICTYLLCMYKNWWYKKLETFSTYVNSIKWVELTFTQLKVSFLFSYF